MKSVVSSFSMTLKQAQDLQEATRGVKNRSAWINAAIKARINGADAFNIGDIGDQQLTLHFHHRFCQECDIQTADFMTCPTYLILSRIAEKGQ